MVMVYGIGTTERRTCLSFAERGKRESCYSGFGDYFVEELFYHFVQRRY